MSASVYTAVGGYAPKEMYESEAIHSDAAYPAPASNADKHASPVAAISYHGASVCAEASLSDNDVRLLHLAQHPDPFAILGPHAVRPKCFAVRVWLKDAARVELKFDEATMRLDTPTAPSTPRRHPGGHSTDAGEEVEELSAGGPPAGNRVVDEATDDAGSDWCVLNKRAAWLFEGVFDWAGLNAVSEAADDLLAVIPIQYSLRVIYENDETQKSFVVHDPFRYGCLLQEADLKLFQSGSCWHVDNLMGSHFVEVEGVRGVRFAVWAPKSAFVSVVGEFNQWDGRAHPMRRRHGFGTWEIYIPDIPRPGQCYMYQIHSSASGKEFTKIDPYAQEFEDPPAHASVLSDCDDAYKPKSDQYPWGDQAWMASRAKKTRNDLHRQPSAIYEVHLPSWMRGDNNSYLSYRELAHRLVAHCKKLHFTHIEFLPLAHHPFEGSWGYQVSGLYAPYSRLGDGDGLKYLVDQLHQHNIGVFVDFVPGHFVKDDWALANFDGEACFEYADPREGEHLGWGTKVFNFRRNEVRSFLLGAAYHWLRRYHFDGLRIDAVSSMLYKNYCRDEWLPNEQGGDANLEAINMLQELNWVCHKQFPGTLCMAEEATSWRGVTDCEKGLGFDYKWDLGWMNDTLSYLTKPKPMRPSAHGKLTFRGLYVAHERWILPLSHDEVVSGKGSLLDKCAFRGATFDERLRTMKALIAYQATLCGRPLLFMGAEFAQGREWNETRSLDWHESVEPARAKFMAAVSDILALYAEEPALHAGDDEPGFNFKWTDCDSSEMCTIAFLRSWEEWYNDVLVICNFSHQAHTRYPVGVPHGGEWRVLLNTDDWAYGGQMGGLGRGMTPTITQGGRLGWPYCLWLDLPPWTALILKAPQPEPIAKLREQIRIAKLTARPVDGLQAQLRQLESNKSQELVVEEATAGAEPKPRSKVGRSKTMQPTTAATGVGADESNGDQFAHPGIVQGARTTTETTPGFSSQRLRKIETEIDESRRKILESVAQPMKLAREPQTPDPSGRAAGDSPAAPLAHRAADGDSAAVASGEKDSPTLPGAAHPDATHDEKPHDEAPHPDQEGMSRSGSDSNDDEPLMSKTRK